MSEREKKGPGLQEMNIVLPEQGLPPAGPQDTRWIVVDGSAVQVSEICAVSFIRSNMGSVVEMPNRGIVAKGKTVMEVMAAISCAQPTLVLVDSWSAGTVGNNTVLWPDTEVKRRRQVEDPGRGGLH